MSEPKQQEVNIIVSPKSAVDAPPANTVSAPPPASPSDTAPLAKKPSILKRAPSPADEHPPTIKNKRVRFDSNPQISGMPEASPPSKSAIQSNEHENYLPPKNPLLKTPALPTSNALSILKHKKNYLTPSLILILYGIGFGMLGTLLGLGFIGATGLPGFVVGIAALIALGIGLAIGIIHNEFSCIRGENPAHGTNYSFATDTLLKSPQALIFSSPTLVEPTSPLKMPLTPSLSCRYHR